MQAVRAPYKTCDRLKEESSYQGSSHPDQGLGLKNIVSQKNQKRVILPFHCPSIWCDKEEKPINILSHFFS